MDEVHAALVFTNVITTCVCVCMCVCVRACYINEHTQDLKAQGLGDDAVALLKVTKPNFLTERSELELN
jgi:hypothetical protein